MSRMSVGMRCITVDGHRMRVCSLSVIAVVPLVCFDPMSSLLGCIAVRGDIVTIRRPAMSIGLMMTTGTVDVGMSRLSVIYLPRSVEVAAEMAAAHCAHFARSRGDTR